MASDDDILAPRGLQMAPDEHPGAEYDDLESAATRIEHEADLRTPVTARLIIIGGNNRGKEHILNVGDNSIGRGLENDIVLADIAVSRKHTLICVEQGRFIVRDLGSGNGTMVNGQKVDVHVLQEGDQLELGKTMLRYIGPQGVSGSNPIIYANQPPMATGPGPMVSHGGPTGQVVPDYSHARMVPPPAQAAAVQYGQAVAAPRVEKRPPLPASRAKKLLVYGGIGLVVLFGSLIALKLVLKSRKAAPPATSPTTSPDQLAAQHFEEATKQFRARNWETARKYYLKVLAVEPGLTKAKQYADRAEAEIKARDALKRAETATSAKDFGGAREELAQVPSTSEYAEEARKLKQALDDKQVQQLLQSARLLKDSGNREDALAKVNEALKIAPSSEAVRAFREQLTSVAVNRPPRSKITPRTHRRPPRKERGYPQRGTGPRPPKPEPPDKPIRAGAGTKHGLGLYRKQQWGPAYEAIEKYAKSQSGRRKEAAKKLASSIYKVGVMMTRAHAIQAANPSQAIGYYKTALQHDRRIPKSPHQKVIKERLRKVAGYLATSSMAAGKYTQAYSAIKMCEKYGRLDASMNKVLGQLDKKASQLFTKAYTIRSSNPKHARKLWQQVLKMVPPSSASYKKAYSWLNNSAPEYQDEDED